MKQSSPRKKEAVQDKLPYAKPEVIYEGAITTRAGTPLGGGDGNGADGVDPADLFE